METAPITADHAAAQLLQAFPDVRRSPDEIRVTWAPGRINILGEHTDYNQGYVLPAATSQGTFVAALPRDDRRFRVYSGALEQTDVFSPRDLRAPAPERHWSAYVRGVAWSLLAEGVDLRGMDAATYGDLAIGAGLASSAALEVAYALALLDAAATSLPETALALACQRAENEYVGVRCGILDQFASIFAHDGAASLIDCRTLRVEPVSIGGRDAVFVVCDTGKPRGLTRSKYNLRRQQCEAAAEAMGVCALRDADMSGLQRHRLDMDGEAYRRARHVISENERVLQGVAALKAGDFAQLGRLLLRTHESLRDDYEVSCFELDEMVEAACSTAGCLGARLIGAGFGGCVLAVVRIAEAQAFCETVEEAYTARTGLMGRTFITSPARGATLLTDVLQS